MKHITQHENDEYELTVDHAPATVHGAFFHSRHHTIRFEDGELVYPAGIGSELLCMTDHYYEVTTSFEARYGDDYCFHGEESHNNQWFHKADFWQYSWDSSPNLYHYIRYASTHLDDDDIDEPSVDDNVTYPFSESDVITFFDPHEKRVRVFAATDDDAVPAIDLARMVFQPRLHVYLSVEDTAMRITVLAHPIHDDHDETDIHSLDSLPSEHVTGVQTLTLDDDVNAIRSSTMNDTEYVLRGELWNILCAISRQQKPWQYASIEPKNRNAFTPYKLVA